MNERIKELKKLATNTYYTGLGEINELDPDKFAELIVRECTAHLHRRGVEGFGILEERNLKEHFGVKSE